ncbi:putative ATP-dependent RNA helicase DDX4, partial [Fragariocoptes setiger]
MENDENGAPPPPPPCRPEEINLEEEAKLKISSGINFDRYERIDVDCHGADIKPVDQFQDLITSPLLLENIAKAGYKKMTPIQKYTIPIMAVGKDMVGCAQTGSGKTAAFILPVLQSLISDPDLPIGYGREMQEPSCIVMAPTRELARQTYVEALKFSQDSVVKCACIYGGTETGWCKAQLSRGANILLSTPGRLKDFINRGLVGLKRLKFVILDEGDRLIDDGFVSDMRAFFTHPDMPSREHRQTMFFSATFKNDAKRIAEEFMKRDYVFITVGMVGAANEDVKQEFVQVTRSDKKRELKKILQSLSHEDKVIVFTQTKATADVISGYLTAQGIECTSIHGDRHQSQREQALAEFKRGTKRCLVASPVGERGLDLPKVSVVINYDLPNHLDEYIHRIGRTGRIGNTGRAVSFFDPERDQSMVDQLKSALKLAQQPIPEFLEGGRPVGASYGGNSDGNSYSRGNSDPAPIEEEVW